MLNRFLETWTNWAVALLVLSAINLALAGILGFVFGLSQSEIAALYLAFMAVYPYRRWQHAREYRRMLKEFQGQIEREAE